jgi:pentatricopeptide repeat protein
MGWSRLATAVGVAVVFSATIAMPTAGQTGDPFAKGLAAAQAAQYPVALEYFTTAYRAEPEKPEIWFDLGLASSKMPGHEYRAMAAFKAYLIAVPDTPRRKAIEDLEAQLAAVIQGRLLTLLDEWQKQATPVYMHDTNGGCMALAEVQALAGFTDRAIKTATSPEPGCASLRDSFAGIVHHAGFISALADAGDLPTALALVTEARRDGVESDADHLVSAFARHGDLTGAERMFAQMIADQAPGEGGVLLICKERRAGNLSKANALMAALQVSATNKSSPHYNKFKFENLIAAMEESKSIYEKQNLNVTAPAVRSIGASFVFTADPEVYYRIPQQECDFPKNTARTLAKLTVEGFDAFYNSYPLSGRPAAETCLDTEMAKCLDLVNKAPPGNNISARWALARALAAAYSFLEER